MTQHNGQNGPHEEPDVSRRAMSSPAADRVFGKHSGYRKLLAYQVAELLYDYTCRFCDRYLPSGDRHHDQMVQAARSGYQNIAEGSEDSATSKKLELNNLTNVTKSSIGELLNDYRKYLKRRGLPLWQAGEPLFEEARALRPKTVAEAAIWINATDRRESADERAANLGASWLPRHITCASVCSTAKLATSKPTADLPSASTAPAPAPAESGRPFCPIRPFRRPRTGIPTDGPGMPCRGRLHFAPPRLP